MFESYKYNEGLLSAEEPHLVFGTHGMSTFLEGNVSYTRKGTLFDAFSKWEGWVTHFLGAKSSFFATLAEVLVKCLTGVFFSHV